MAYFGSSPALFTTTIACLGWGANALNLHVLCTAVCGGHFVFIFFILFVPGAPMTSIFEGQPLKTRSFPFKTRVIWVTGSFDFHLSIFIFVLSTTVCLSSLGKFQATVHVDCPPLELRIL